MPNLAERLSTPEMRHGVVRHIREMGSLEDFDLGDMDLNGQTLPGYILRTLLLEIPSEESSDVTLQNWLGGLAWAYKKLHNDVSDLNDFCAYPTEVLLSNEVRIPSELLGRVVPSRHLADENIAGHLYFRAGHNDDNPEFGERLMELIQWQFRQDETIVSAETKRNLFMTWKKLMRRDGCPDEMKHQWLIALSIWDYYDYLSKSNASMESQVAEEGWSYFYIDPVTSLSLIGITDIDLGFEPSLLLSSDFNKWKQFAEGFKGLLNHYDELKEVYEVEYVKDITERIIIKLIKSLPSNFKGVKEGKKLYNCLNKTDIKTPTVIQALMDLCDESLKQQDKQGQALTLIFLYNLKSSLASPRSVGLD